MFDSIVSRAVTTSEGGKTKILGVVLENKSGREYFTADMFVDATGDGDLMYRAGIPTVERGNYHSYFPFAITLDSCRKAAETGKIANAISGVSGGYASLYGENHPKDIPLYHGTSSDEVNRYLISNQLEMLEKLKKDDRNSRDVVTLPGMCQFRTVRHIAGAYTLLESDTYRHFEDSVGAMNDFDRRVISLRSVRDVGFPEGFEPYNMRSLRGGRGVRVGCSARDSSGDHFGAGCRLRCFAGG